MYDVRVETRSSGYLYVFLYFSLHGSISLHEPYEYLIFFPFLSFDVEYFQKAKVSVREYEVPQKLKNVKSQLVSHFTLESLFAERIFNIGFKIHKFD